MRRIIALLILLAFAGLTGCGDRASLIDAIVKEDVARARELIDKGADVNLRDENGLSPVIIAARSGNTELVEVLVKAGACDANDAFQIAMINEDVSLAKTIVRAGGHVDLGAGLQIAILHNRPSLVEALFAMGLDPSNLGFDPVEDAIRGGHTGLAPLLEKLIRERSTAVGLDVSLIDAILRGDSYMVKQMLDAGIDPETPDQLGRSALTVAVMEGNSPEIVRLLISKGARTDCVLHGSTLLEWSLMKHAPEIALILAEGGAPGSENYPDLQKYLDVQAVDDLTQDGPAPEAVRELAELGFKRQRAVNVVFMAESQAKKRHKGSLNDLRTLTDCSDALAYLEEAFSGPTAAALMAAKFGGNWRNERFVHTEVESVGGEVLWRNAALKPTFISGNGKLRRYAFLVPWYSSWVLRQIEIVLATDGWRLNTIPED